MLPLRFALPLLAVAGVLAYVIALDAGSTPRDVAVKAGKRYRVKADLFAFPPPDPAVAAKLELPGASNVKARTTTRRLLKPTPQDRIVTELSYDWTPLASETLTLNVPQNLFGVEFTLRDIDEI